MLLKPGTSSTTKIVLDATSEFLEREYTGLRHLFERVGTRYQLAEAFLLMKAMSTEAIQEMLSKHDATTYEDIIPVIRYEMRARVCGRRTAGQMVSMLDTFTETGKIHPQLLEAYATVVKSNVEIKLLMALFGFHQIPYAGSEDGTGALPVSSLSGKKGSRVIQRGDSRSAGEIFLIDNFDKCGILVLKDAHWSAIKGLVLLDGRVLSLYFLDPGINRDREFRLDPWDARARLYFFSKESRLETGMSGIVNDMFLKDDPGQEGGMRKVSDGSSSKKEEK